MPIRKKIKNSKSQAHEAQTKPGKQPILQKTPYFWRQQTSAWPGKTTYKQRKRIFSFHLYKGYWCLNCFSAKAKFIPKWENLISRDKSVENLPKGIMCKENTSWEDAGEVHMEMPEGAGLHVDQTISISQSVCSCDPTTFTDFTTTRVDFPPSKQQNKY